MADEKTRWATIGALWENNGRGRQKYGGNISLGLLGEVKIMVFPNPSSNPKAPDFNIATPADGLLLNVLAREQQNPEEDHARRHEREDRLQEQIKKLQKQLGDAERDFLAVRRELEAARRQPPLTSTKPITPPEPPAEPETDPQDSMPF